MLQSDRLSADQDDKNTRLAEQRTLLEHERTLAAWIRTALATLVLGLAAAELLRTVELAWLAQAIGATLVVVGGCLLAAAYWSYRAAIQELERRKVPGLPPWVVASLITLLVLSAAASLVLIVW